MIKNIPDIRWSFWNIYRIWARFRRTCLKSNSIFFVESIKITVTLRMITDFLIYCSRHVGGAVSKLKLNMASQRQLTLLESTLVKFFHCCVVFLTHETLQSNCNWRFWRFWHFFPGRHLVTQKLQVWHIQTIKPNWFLSSWWRRFSISPRVGNNTRQTEV